MCRFFSFDGACKFGEDCAFLYKTNVPNVEKLFEEIQQLKDHIKKVDEILNERERTKL